MADKQGWVTYASTDQEALKALALARSLRLAITRRQLIVITSDKLSSLIWSLLQNEYDCVIRIPESSQVENFKLLAQAYCWELKKLRKFAFLDCNCMILKNADEIFKSSGFSFSKQEDNTKEISIIASSHADNLALESLHSSGFQLNNTCIEKMWLSVDILSSTILSGNDLKIVIFFKNHPLDLLFDKSIQIDLQKVQGFGKTLLEQFMNLLPINIFTTAKIPLTDLNPSMLNFVNQATKNKGIAKTSTELYGPDVSQLTELRDSIAIVGMAFRFPGANTIEQFWDLLSKGQEGIIKLPSERWTKERCFSRNKNLQATQAGFLQCPIDEIDGRFFGINAAELEYMDPQQRLMLQIVWEGLENAGIPPNEIKEKLTGVFGGWWRNDYREMLQEAGLNESEFFRAYMGNALGTVTGRISHCLELTGPSVSTESGCSTSIVGVDLACNSLREENCDIALEVGVNLLLHPFTIDTMNQVIAMDGRCKTFDAKADGFGRAEGCAVLVLKRFSDAVADGDNIWALIRGSAVVQEGPSKSLGTPTVECEALAMSLALERAGVLGKDVSFVETHGTGTPVGDPLEVAAVAKVYSKNREDVLTIGSVKTNIGHTESVSGIAGIVKTVLSMQNEIIPQHLHLETLNPAINLDIIPAQIPLKPLKWEKLPGKPRIAGVSSFGITGTDAHVIVQETPNYPQEHSIIGGETPIKMLTISAKCPEALVDYIEKYKSYLMETTDDLNHIEYTGHVGKGHYSFRMAVTGETKHEILQKLKKKEYETKIASSTTDSPKICFLFTGQGSQYAGMAEDLYKSNLVFQTNFDECEKIVNETHGFSVKEAIWGNNQAQLSRSLFSQTSIFCIEICLFKLWESWGVTPDVVLGHSLGEFAAAVAAGILSFETALNLVCTRSKLIDSLPQGKMLVIKENVSVVQTLMQKYIKVNTNGQLEIAAVNSPEQTVLAGNTEVIINFSEFCKNNGVKTHVLDATHAFHSSHMDPILEEYGVKADKLFLNARTNCHNKIKFISGMEGKIMKPEHLNANYWVRHTREAVRFLEASKVAFEKECNTFIEIGPQPVLSAMILTNSDVTNLKVGISCVLPSIRKNESNWKTILASLAKLYANGVEINWKNYHRYSNSEHKNKVKLPSYPFQMKSHWMEMKESESTPFHPLVGWSVPNPSPIKIFRSQIDPIKIHYLMDHMVGTRVIFPGAGYMEMTLAAGHAALQGAEGISGGLAYTPPNTPVTMKNFKIVGPLCLNDKGTTEMQVVVTPPSEDSDGGVLVTVYSKMILDKETYKWVPHSSGTFSPFDSKWDGEEDFRNDSLEKIKERCSSTITCNEGSYDKLQEFGMMFGPTFQTIQNVYRASNGLEVCCEVKVTDDPSEYICHPVMIDAMFQALMIAINQNTSTLHVPISTSQFICSGKITTSTCYVYCKTFDSGNEAKGKESTAILMDGNGKLVAVMVGAELISTTVKSLMAVLDAQRVAFPNMYENIWREQLGPMELRWSDTVNVPETSDGIKAIGFNNLNDKEKVYYETSNTIVALYMMKALKELGFQSNVKFGDVIDIKSLADKLNVNNSLNRFFNYIIVVLTEDGYFKQIGGNGTQLKQIVQIKEFVTDVDSCIKISAKDIRAVDFECMRATGEHLADILTGHQSALNILFPDDTRVKGPAEAYYQNSSAFNSISEAGTWVFQKLLQELKLKRGTKKSVLRILEVGAGTGSLTQHLLPYILEDGFAFYEYTYTDISSVFFGNGKQVFENTKVRTHYKLLNIEEDPITQGFQPHHYDLIIAGFVLHATENIETSLINIRKVLSDVGAVIVCDSLKPLRSLNILFGALEGYWRFTDTNSRPYNCEMELDQWEKTFSRLNFENFSVVQTFNSHFGMLMVNSPTNISKNDIKSIIHSTNYSQTVWIVFSAGDPTSEFIIMNLLQMEKKVILAKSSDFKDFKNPHQLELYNISHENTEDILRIFQSVSNSKDIEGLIYLWPLFYEENSTANNQACTRYNYAHVCQPLLNLYKYLSGSNIGCIKLYVFTREAMDVEGNLLKFPIISPVHSMTKSFQNENSQYNVRCVDLDCKSKEYFEVTKEAFAELFIDDGEIFVCYRNNHRLVQRCLSWKMQNTALQFPQSPYFRLMLAPTNTISDLRFCQMDQIPIEADEIEIKVKAYALNFRDLFSILKPDKFFQDMDTVGIDCAGIVTAVGCHVTTRKVGDLVFGVNLKGGTLPSSTQMHESMVIEIPTDMTFNEAATLPAVAATCYVCLIECANLMADDTILIHTGSGGVGLCAIQMAQSIGCTIVTTAGSNRKRAYLKNLGIEHIFNSRTTDYGADIVKALGGSGVDVVLNSLTGPGFKEATLAACNPNARFVEMSKLNTWTEEEIKALRPDIQYHLVDLSSDSEETQRKQMKSIQPYIQKSTIKPLPYVRFDASEIRDALTFMQKAKHIGKIVCVMPDDQSLLLDDKVRKCSLFNDRSSYLITGGLGGIGFEVAKWMVTSGAKHLILVGRNPPSETIATEIKKLQSRGINIKAARCDVAIYEECKKLLQSLEVDDSEFPLRGIMHAAGVLSDGTYNFQSWEKYETTFHPKVRGGINLHELTLGKPLEMFVMFSSAVSVLGGMGQSNHAAANYFLDSLVHYRNSIGLPGTTVNWGQWAQVGVAANIEVAGLKPFTVLQGISALDKILRSNKSQIMVLDADIKMLCKNYPAIKIYLQEIKISKSSNDSETSFISKDEFWKKYEASETYEEKYSVMKHTLEIVIRGTLKMDSDDTLEENMNFQDLGMDSLMMIEMKNSIQSSIGDKIKISVSSVRDCKTLAQLTTKLIEVISGEFEIQAPSRVELQKLIQEDSILSDDIQPDFTTSVQKSSEIKTVLLTGGSGNLGPYILQEILKQNPYIEKVYCLMRSEVLPPIERLTTLLKDKKLFEQINMDKVECIEGDIVKPKLGLSDNDYSNLVSTVDSVFHIAGKTNYDEFYAKTEQFHHTRMVNVTGMKNIIKFACDGKTKHFFHASSLTSTTKLGKTGGLSEDWPIDGEFDNIHNSAFPISKYICDRLLSQAVERGLPAKSFRFPSLGGDSKKGGNISLFGNRLLMRMISYMYLGVMPARNLPVIVLSVDVCAKLAVKVFLNDKAGYEIYNVSNPHVGDELELEDIAKDHFGYTIETVETEDFFKKVEELDEQKVQGAAGEIVALIKKGVKFQKAIAEIEENLPEPITAWVTGQKDVFLSKKLQSLVPEYVNSIKSSWDVIKADLQHAKESGFFNKIGLN